MRPGLGSGIAQAVAGRRSTMRRIGAAAVLASLQGCGFKLRGAAPLSFSRISLVGIEARSHLGQELRRQLGGRVQIVDTPAQSQLVLRIESAQRERVVTGLTASGLVRELALRLRVRFSLALPQGRLLIDSTELVLQRDMATNESAALAKAQEEEEIFRAVERDVALQIVRRLEAVPASGHSG